PAATIEGDCQPLLDRQAQMVSTFKAHIQITFDFFAEGDLLATGAFDPDIGRPLVLADAAVGRRYRRLCRQLAERGATMCGRFRASIAVILHFAVGRSNKLES